MDDGSPSKRPRGPNSVRNPYLNARSNTPSKASSEGGLSTSDGAQIQEPLTSSTSKTLNEELAPPGMPSPSPTTTETISNSNPSADAETAAQGEKKEDVVARPRGDVIAQPINTGLSYWERLPSKNLSFGPAEILTVDECVKHSALYRGRSVRVTGQLHQRTFVGDDVQTPQQVLLELIDPILPTPSDTPVKSSAIGCKTPKKTSLKKTTAGESTTATPAKSLQSTLTPGTSLKTPFKTPLKTFGPRRSLGSGSGSGIPSSLLKSSTKNPLWSSKRKRPWFATSTKKKSPPNAPPRLLLKVLADPNLPHLSIIAPSGASKVMVIGTVSDDGIVTARFVALVDPRTDMTLYQNSVLSRRRFLYRRYKENQQQGTCSIIPPKDAAERSPSTDEASRAVSNTSSACPSTPPLVQGCGPPPYTVLEHTEGSGNA